MSSDELQLANERDLVFAFLRWQEQTEEDEAHQRAYRNKRTFVALDESK